MNASTAKRRNHSPRLTGRNAVMAGCVFLTGLLAFQPASASAPPEPIAVRIGHASGGSMSLAVGLLLEAQPDLLRKHGLVVDWSDFSATPNNCVSAVVAGQTDACSTGLPTMLAAIGQGGKLRTVGAYSHPQISLILSRKTASEKGVRPESPLAERIEAIKGVSFARPPQGTTGYATLALLLQPFNLSLDDFGTTYEMFDPSAMAAGVRVGKWDAASWSSGPIDQAVVDGSAYLWVSLPEDAPEAASFPSHGMLVSDSFAEANPEAARRLYAAIKDATALLRAHDPDAIESLRSRFFSRMSPELFNTALGQAIAALIETPDISPEAFQKLVEFTKYSAPRANYEDMTYAGIVDTVARTKP
ncbi:MAG: ABC transporter substrate-binding protein [Pigmentiphaga sp.]